MRFEIESSFAERLAGLIPSAPVRQIFLEAAILPVIGQAFEVERMEFGAPEAVLLNEGLGVLLTEPGSFDVPELLVVFAYDQPWAPDTVFLHYVSRTDPEDF